jgi:hypothetical protein
MLKPFDGEVGFAPVVGTAIVNEEFPMFENSARRGLSTLVAPMTV